MSGVLAKHIAKLTVTLLVLATIGASAFVQSLHTDNLRKDAAALRTIAARQGIGGLVDGRLPDRARAWLAETHADIEARHATARRSIQDLLERTGVPRDEVMRSKEAPARSGDRADPMESSFNGEDDDHGPVWRLIRVNDRLSSPVSVLGPGVSRKTMSGSVSEVLDRFLTDHTPVSYEVLVGVHVPESTGDAGALEPGTRISSVALTGPTAVEIAARPSGLANVANQAVPRRTSIRLAADLVTVAGPSPADLILGKDREATELRFDAARIGRVDRLYGGLNLDEARGIISRAIASRYDAVNLLGVEFPAEYFALALAFACATVMLGIVSTLRLAVARGTIPLAFEDTESLAALLLGSTWGRTLLWLILPLLAMIGARPDSWLAGWGIWVFVTGVALTLVLGLVALRLGSLATRDGPAGRP